MIKRIEKDINATSYQQGVVVRRCVEMIFYAVDMVGLFPLRISLVPKKKF